MAHKSGPAAEAFERLSFLAFRVFRASVNALPLPLALALGDALAAGWWLVDVRHRQLALRNIGIAYPDMHLDERRMLAFRNFRHLSRVLVETFRLGRIDRSNWHEYIRLERTGNFDNAIALGRGLIGISAHQGNWEMLSGHAFQYGRVCIVARKIHNKGMDREIRERRENTGAVQIYPDRESPRNILRALREGMVVCFLIDQSARGEEGVDVPFFGKPAPTHSSPALFALRTGAPVVPVWIDRDRSGFLHMYYGRQIDLVRTGDLQADVVANTALFTSSIEEIIRRRPEQWFWVHDRWRISKRKRRRRGG